MCVQEMLRPFPAVGCVWCWGVGRTEGGVCDRISFTIEIQDVKRKEKKVVFLQHLKFRTFLFGDELW